MEQKKMLLKAVQTKGAIVALTASLIALIFFTYREAAGIIIGGAVGIFNFVILIRFVYALIQPESAGGRIFISSLYAAKLFLFFALFFVIAKWGFVNLIAVIAGFSIILIILIYEGLRQTNKNYNP